MPFTLMFSTRERMPCPSSCIAMVSTNANHTANVEGTYSFIPGRSRMFWGAYIPVGSGRISSVKWSEKKSMMVIAMDMKTTMKTPNEAYARRIRLKRLNRSRNPTLAVFMAMIGP